MIEYANALWKSGTRILTPESYRPNVNPRARCLFQYTNKKKRLFENLKIYAKRLFLKRTITGF
jgi:hypothetical protein